MGDGIERERSDVVSGDPYVEALTQIGVALALGPGDEAAIRRQLTHPTNLKALVARAGRLAREGDATNVELREVREELRVSKEGHQRALAVITDLRRQFHAATAETEQARTRAERAEEKMKRFKKAARALTCTVARLLA